MTQVCIGAADPEDEDEDDDDDRDDADESRERERSPTPDDENVRAIYDELKRMAGNLLRREGPFYPHDRSSVLNTVWCRLLASGRTWKDEGHFYATAAVAMKYYLIDEAKKKARMRGRRVDVELDSLCGDSESTPDYDDLIALDLALQRLKVRDEMMWSVVHLKFFVSLTDAQAGRVLDVSEKTVERKWAHARVWLKNEIRRSRDSDDAA